MKHRILTSFLLLLTAGTVAHADFGTTRTTYEPSEPRLRRAAVGLSAGGLAGRFGTDLQLNFTKEVSFLAGYGISTDFQSLFLGMRLNLVEWILTPYATGGYAQWYASKRRSVGKTTPGFLADRFLSQKEREEGRFHENLLFGSLGLEYMHPSGDFAGAAVYVEALMLADLDDLVTEPTVGLGARYYF